MIVDSVLAQELSTCPKSHVKGSWHGFESSSRAPRSEGQPHSICHRYTIQALSVQTCSFQTPCVYRRLMERGLHSGTDNEAATCA